MFCVARPPIKSRLARGDAFQKCEHAHGPAACGELTGHFVSDDSAEAETTKEIGAVRLKLQDFIDVSGCHLFDSGERLLGRPYPDGRLIGAQEFGDLAVIEKRPAA